MLIKPSSTFKSVPGDDKCLDDLLHGVLSGAVVLWLLLKGSGSGLIDHFLFRVWDSIANTSGTVGPDYPKSCSDGWKLTRQLRPEGADNECPVFQDAPLTVPSLTRDQPCEK